MRCYRKTGVNRSLLALLSGFAFVAVPGASAGSGAISYLTHDARPVGSLRLCTPPGESKQACFACRDYRASDGEYTLMFQGGTMPRTMLHRPLTGEPAAIDLTERRESWASDLTRPSQIPEHVRHVGTGVCTTSQEPFVPCAVFWESSSPGLIVSHLVFYDPAGGGSTRVDIATFQATSSVANGCW